MNLDDILQTLNSIKMESDIEPMQTGKASGWLGEYHWVSLPINEDNKYN